MASPNPEEQTMRSAAILLLLGLGAAQQSMPEPPEHYAAIETWIEGEIVAMEHAGGVLHVVPTDPSDPRSDQSARSLARGGPQPDAGSGDRAALLELRYAKGWMYFDDPDGGEQRRYNLREGRQRLRLGQHVAIGRANDFRGGHESSRVNLGGMITTRFQFEGWILVRVSPFRAEPD